MVIEVGDIILLVDVVWYCLVSDYYIVVYLFYGVWMSMMRNILIGEDVYFDILKREIVIVEESVILGGREVVILYMLCFFFN